MSASEWDDIFISAKVISITKNNSNKIRLDVEVYEIQLAEISSTEEFKSRVLWDIQHSVELGDVIHFKGTLIPISGARNPSNFSYKNFLSKKGIYTQIRADSLLSRLEITSELSWLSIRKKALKLVDRNFNDKTAPIAKALLLGYKNELEGETRQAFARAGLSHIMAVSGLHVGLVIAPFWLIIPYFWTKRYGPIIGLSLLGLLLFFYAGIIGFSSPVLRASVMAMLLTYGKLFSKNSNSINLMGVAALLILIADPSQVFEIGFQLSFSAVLIILLILPVIQNAIPYWVRIKWYGSPIMVIIISLVVQIGLYPLQAYYFGEVSVISPIANALFVPFLGLFVPLSLISLIVSILTPSIGYILNYPSLLFLEWMHSFVQLSSSLSWAWVTVSKPSALIFVFWSFFILMIGSWRNPAIKWKLLSTSLLMVLTIQIVSLVSIFENQKMKLIVFDVGQGDASLITTPNGKHILIDAGIWSPGSNSGEQVLLPYFKENDINKLDAVFLSHPHADHIGGIISLLEGIKIEVIYNSGYEYESELYKNYLKLAEKEAIPVISLRSGDKIDIDESILVLVLGPEGNRFNNDPNQHSLFLNIIYGENEFLFTGDAGEDQERRIVENYGHLLDTDFLKVGHHGSKTSSETFFLNEVTPDIAVVSLANKNRFRHPHQEAIVRLERTGAEIFYTGRDKALVFESNGKTIKRILWD
jgi:competence protein ComEC